MRRTLESSCLVTSISSPLAWMLHSFYHDEQLCGNSIPPERWHELTIFRPACSLLQRRQVLVYFYTPRYALHDWKQICSPDSSKSFLVRQELRWRSCTMLRSWSRLDSLRSTIPAEYWKHHSIQPEPKAEVCAKNLHHLKEHADHGTGSRQDGCLLRKQVIVDEKPVWATQVKM